MSSILLWSPALVGGSPGREALLQPLITSLARMSAKASADLGIELDVADPRVVRWMIQTSFEALLAPSARRSLEETLAIAADLPESDLASARPRGCKGRSDRALVTWDRLAASAGRSIKPSLGGRRGCRQAR
jgi:hypothetical protein